MSDDAAAGGQRRLERRARRLLRAYPPSYRAAWGEEIVGTLLEATSPGWNWPPVRHQASVLRAGVSARRTVNGQIAADVSLRQAAVLGIAVYLSSFVRDLNLLAYPGWPSRLLAVNSLILIATLAATVTSAWSGRRWLAAAAAAVSAAAFVWRPFSMGGPGSDHPGLTGLVMLLTFPLLALGALVCLARAEERPPASWFLIPALPLAAAGLTTIAAHLPLGPILSVAGRFTFWGNVISPLTDLVALALVVAVCWLSTDARPLLGLALGLVFMQSGTIFANLLSGSGGTGFWVAMQLIEFAVSAVAASALVWLLFRRTTTPMPYGPMPMS